MASGHVNRTYRPNTWQHRPSLQREVFSCQLGAVHTWHQADMARCPTWSPLCEQKRTLRRSYFSVTLEHAWAALYPLPQIEIFSDEIDRRQFGRRTQRSVR